MEAWAVAGISRADLFPHVNLNPSYTDTGLLFEIYLPPGLSIPGLNTAKTIYRVHELQYTLPFTMTYELDLWGKLRGQYDSAALNAVAQEEALRTALLTLTSEIATDYFLLRSLDAQVDLLKWTIDLRQKAYDLNSSRYNRGLSTLLDVTNAEVELTNAEADYEDIIRQRTLQENAIATLIGTPASNFRLAHSPLLLTPPCVPVGIPSTVLKQRPDIAEAERMMASQHALIGVAYANFFPTVDLTGILGFSSPDLKDFLSGRSRFWSMGINISQVIFDAGKNVSNLEVVKARYEEAVGAYQQQVLTAFQEVEDSLNNLEMQAKQAESLQKSVAAAHKTTQLSMQRYKEGLINYFEVVDNQRTELDAEQTALNLLGQRYLSTIQLIKAFGGSWNY